MVFAATGVASNKAVSFSFDAAETAPQRAKELESRRALDTLATDGEGLQYPPSEFERVFLADGRTI